MALYVGIDIGLINMNVGIFASLNIGFDIGFGASTDFGWILA